MKRILIILLAFLAVTPLIALAASPTQIAPDTDTLPSDYQIQLLEYSPDTYVTFDQNIYADTVEIYNDHTYFTNMALGAASNPTQTFGLASEDGNVTISEINGGDIRVTMECTAGQTCYASYYYPSSVIVHAVEVNVAGTTTIITNYHADETEFNNAPAPAVLIDTSTRFVKVKVVYSEPTTIRFFVQNAGGSQGGGGGGGDGGIGLPVIIPPPASSTSGELTVTVAPIVAKRGETVSHEIIIEWVGSKAVTIHSITFGQNPEWFNISKTLPFEAVLDIQTGQPAQYKIVRSVPFEMTVPGDVRDTVPDRIDVEVVASSGANISTARVPMHVSYSTNADLAIASALFIGAGVIVIGAFRKLRRK